MSDAAELKRKFIDEFAPSVDVPGELHDMFRDALDDLLRQAARETMDIVEGALREIREELRR